MTTPEVIAIGEILIDFIPDKIANLRDLKSFEKCPGGAPANLIVGLANLGVNTGFIGKVGDDPFGDFLIQVLDDYGVNTENVIKSEEGERTTLAFVYYDMNLDRDFFFYRHNAADTKLKPNEINSDIFKEIKFLHFGSVSLSTETVRSATFEAINLCKKFGGKVCFDPNIRQTLWKNEKELRKFLDKGLQEADIFMPSEIELDYITENIELNDQEKIDVLFAKYDLELIVVKKGSEGCLIKERDGFLLSIPSFDVNLVDSTGAGDGFNAGFIFGLVNGLSLEEAGILGNAIGGIVIQRKGALSSLPTKEELNDFLEKHKVKIDLKE